MLQVKSIYLLLLLSITIVSFLNFINNGFVHQRLLSLHRKSKNIKLDALSIELKNSILFEESEKTSIKYLNIVKRNAQIDYPIFDMDFGLDEVGCFKDTEGATSHTDVSTPYFCVKHCLQMLKNYALLKASACSCLENLMKGVAAPHQQCSFACPNNRTKICGGIVTVSVFRTKCKSGTCGQEKCVASQKSFVCTSLINPKSNTPEDMNNDFYFDNENNQELLIDNIDRDQNYTSNSSIVNEEQYEVGSNESQANELINSLSQDKLKLKILTKDGKSVEVLLIENPAEIGTQHVCQGEYVVFKCVYLIKMHARYNPANFRPQVEWSYKDNVILSRDKLGTIKMKMFRNLKFDYNCGLQLHQVSANESGYYKMSLLFESRDQNRKIEQLVHLVVYDEKYCPHIDIFSTPPRFKFLSNGSELIPRQKIFFSNAPIEVVYIPPTYFDGLTITLGYKMVSEELTKENKSIPVMDKEQFSPVSTCTNVSDVCRYEIPLYRQKLTQNCRIYAIAILTYQEKTFMQESFLRFTLNDDVLMLKSCSNKQMYNTIITLLLFINTIYK